MRCLKAMDVNKEAPVIADEARHHSILVRSLCQIISFSGCVSYGGFSIYISSPDIYRKWFGESDVVVAYALWLNTHICLGTHLYRQRHLQTAPCLDRILFTALSTTMFNFGSVLLWASIKQIIPDRSGQRTLLSVGIGTCLLWMGQRYVNFINKNF